MPGNCSGGTTPIPTPPQPASSRTRIEVNDWEKQLLAIAAFVEMHGHGQEQAIAIIWVALNRAAGMTPITDGFFAPNRNFSGTSQIASYVLSRGQFAISVVLAEEYDLLTIGDCNNWEPVEGMTLKQVVAQAYENLNNFYDGEVDDYLEWVNEVIAAYNSGAPDPTKGAVWYGHVAPDKADGLVANLQAYAESLGLASQFTYEVFSSERPINPISLIVNNLTYAP